MFDIKTNADKEQNYKSMVASINDLLETETDLIANLSNISAFINAFIDKLNWVGFYLLKDNELVLGPFQGQPACIRIKMGKGLCGAAAQQQKILVVENVHAFPGHIACDSNTNSEIVLPLYRSGKIFGVLDLDSPQLARFTALEEKYLSQTADLISRYLQ